MLTVRAVDAGPTPGDASSFSYNGLTVPSGLSQSILVVLMNYGSGGPATLATALTWNGISLTALGEHNGGSAIAYAQQGIYYLLNPAAGNNALAASFTANGSLAALIYAATILVCSGVDQTTIWRGAAQSADGASGTSPSLGITTVAGDLAIDIATASSNGGGNQVSQGGSQTVIGLRNNYQASWSTGSSYHVATGATTTDTWAQTQASVWTQLGAALIPAAGGRIAAIVHQYLRHVAHH